jgi:hypothetical protein
VEGNQRVAVILESKLIGDTHKGCSDLRNSKAGLEVESIIINDFDNGSMYIPAANLNAL